MNRYSRFYQTVFSLFVFFQIVPLAIAQRISDLAPARITTPIKEASLVTLKGNTHPLAKAANDRGPAPDALPMQRMQLVLKRSPEQKAALKNLLASQQDKNSPSYHQWLTPQAFGSRFGASAQDVATVTGWLQGHGFTVNRVANGRSSVEFSGTAAQVRTTFHTAIHKFTVRGEDHYANVSDPQIPAALTPVVGGVASLHNFRSKPLYIPTPGMGPKPLPGPAFNSPVAGFNSSGSFHLLAPADYNTIYNIAPLNAAGTNGTKSVIAVVARSNFNLQDVVDFRSKFGLTANPPQIIYNGPDPGVIDGDDVEATIDASWSGAIASGATVEFVVSADTYVSDGIDLSEQYIVDNNVGDVITESYGLCELFVGQSYVDQLDAVREQAAAQGQTFVVSAGDSGSYGCDSSDESSISDEYPTAVNVRASSPYITSMGGTQFNENGSPATYWSAQNTPVTLGSALSFIPENVWNEGCGYDFCFQSIAAGGGGQSVVYAKPAFQAGVVGIPNDGSRDLPDISLAASAGHDPYLFCYQGSCQQQCQGIFCFYGAGGTSFGAPSFAGIVALLKQKTGERQGNLNPALYALAAAEKLSSCNGSGTSLPASNCIFNDTTVGSNDVTGDPDFGDGSGPFQATVGYDLATGLGSLNVTNFINFFKALGTAATTTSLSISPTTLVHGSNATVNIAVAPKTTASTTPSGPVALESGTGTGVAAFPLSNGTVSSTTGQLPGGSYQISALYGGDSTFAGSSSNPVTLNVTPEPSVVTVYPYNTCPDYGFCSFNGGPYGTPLYITTAVSGASGQGYPSGAVVLTDNGNPFSTGAAPIAGANTLSSGGSSNTQPIGLLPVGAHVIKATYAGDASFQASASAPVTFNIQPARVTSGLSANPPCGLPASGVALNASFYTSSLGAPMTGTVTFLAGGTVLAAAVPVKAAVESGTNFATATASFTATALTAGTTEIVAIYSGDTNYLNSTATLHINVGGSTTCLSAVVNSASYSNGGTLAPGGLVAIFGSGFATSTVSATTSPLPFVLAGTSVSVTDSYGNTEPAELVFVSPGQINCVVPPGLYAGTASFQISGPAGSSQLFATIEYAAPGLFSADASGKGLAAAQIIRISPDGNQTTQSVTSAPIAFNGDQLVLVLYGTGFDFGEYYYNGVYFGGEFANTSYIGPQGSFDGLDQINVDLPPTLTGSGTVNVQAYVNGYYSNVVTLVF